MASLAIVWRLALLSWDSPVTQLQDEAATQGLAHADVFRQVTAHALAAVQPGRLHAPGPAVVVEMLPLGADLTRSPPRS